MPDLCQPTSYRETRFRLPSGPEQALGLWLDRLGAETRTADPPDRLRLLGQYAAVAVESGRGLFESPLAGRLTVAAGDVLVLFPEEPTRYYGAPTWSTRWIVWNGPEAAAVVRLSGLTPARPLVPQAAAEVARTFGALRPLLAAEDFPAVLERKRLLLGLLAALLRHADPARDGRHDALAALVRQLSEQSAPAPSVAAMAAACHLSLAQFRRRFHAYTGRSPHRFVTAMRMTEAKTLLAQGWPMKEVAVHTGYREVFHFMRVFKATVGQTAGQFVAAQRRPG